MLVFYSFILNHKSRISFVIVHNWKINSSAQESRTNTKQVIAQNKPLRTSKVMKTYLLFFSNLILDKVASAAALIDSIWPDSIFDRIFGLANQLCECRVIWK
jgi:hypothetical protein